MDFKGWSQKERFLDSSSASTMALEQKIKHYLCKYETIAKYTLHSNSFSAVIGGVGKTHD